ncbi:equilibrative nucleotide transporter 1 [Carex rostrata]
MGEEDTTSISISDERKRLLTPSPVDHESESEIRLESEPPQDYFSIGYLIYFTLGAGFLIPWNAFITAVDYFTYLYPAVPVDRVFSVSYMFSCFIPLLFIVAYAHKSSASLRINSGLSLFTLALIIVPVMDAVYVKGRQRMYPGYDVTVAATVLCGVADALVQGGVIGSAGELPERYMQATVAGTAASGVLVSVLRVITKAVYPQDSAGLRKSAILYFVVSIVIMIICVICYNVADRLPVVQHYKNIKLQAQKEEGDRNTMTGTAWRSTLWSIIGRIKWFGFGIFLIYMVTLSIFPGYITEDVHSEALKDWYPIILIACYNIFDLAGKVLPAYYLLENANIAIAGCVARLLFYPLFLACLHGPQFFRTEVPVTILTCLLGLTNGYLTGIVMILAPKAVPIQHAETAGIAIVLFLVIGLVFGSLVSWFWVI